MMRPNDVAKHLKLLLLYGSEVLSKDNVAAIEQASLAYDAIRRMLNVQWELEQGNMDFSKEINKILGEFHEIDDEIPNAEPIRKICGNCIHLSDEKTGVGRKCICPDRIFHSSTAMWKQPSCPACKNFERRQDTDRVRKE